MPRVWVGSLGLAEFKSVKKLLDQNKIAYVVSEHAPVYTSEEAAKVRGVELKTGVKALILKTDSGDFVVALIAANRKIDLKKLAKAIGAKKLRLASAKEVLMVAGCEVGSVHPFGNLFGLPTYSDGSVLENDMVNFNAGMHTVSIQMKAKDLVKTVRPIITDFSK